jgi:hypothetical protein
MLKRNIKMQSRRGRPLLLDQEFMTYLSEFVTAQSASKRALKTEINQEYEFSKIRKYDCIDTEEDCRLMKRDSLGRYVDRFVCIVN